jgi:hypothetical protein
MLVRVGRYVGSRARRVYAQPQVSSHGSGSFSYFKGSGTRNFHEQASSDQERVVTQIEARHRTAKVGLRTACRRQDPGHADWCRSRVKVGRFSRYAC